MDSLVLHYPVGHQKHYLPGHPERPGRIEAIREGLEETGAWDACRQVEPQQVPEGVLAAVHDPEYLSLLERFTRRGGMLDPDTYATRDTWQLALNAAGGAVAVVDQVWEQAARAGFALSRPPGHHATRSRAMGFCLINNIAVAAEYLLQAKGAKKIAIVDLDLHHGNGTQDIFWEKPEVAYVSIHQAPFYPGTGALYDVGGGAGTGSTLNLPVPAFSGDSAYQTLLTEVIIPFLGEQHPEVLLISFGFDTHWRDPLGSMQVSASCVYSMIGALRAWAAKECSGRIAVILEGGYDLDAGKACGQAVTAALLDQPWEDPVGLSPNPEGISWQETLQQALTMLGYR